MSNYPDDCQGYNPNYPWFDDAEEVEPEDDPDLDVLDEDIC